MDISATLQTGQQTGDVHLRLDSMLGQHCRLWANIHLTLGKHLVFEASNNHLILKETIIHQL